MNDNSTYFSAVADNAVFDTVTRIIDVFWLANTDNAVDAVKNARDIITYIDGIALGFAGRNTHIHNKLMDIRALVIEGAREWVSSELV